jgi:hypothetical protein
MKTFTVIVPIIRRSLTMKVQASSREEAIRIVASRNAKGVAGRRPADIGEAFTYSIDNGTWAPPDQWDIIESE